MTEKGQKEPESYIRRLGDFTPVKFALRTRAAITS